MSLYNMHILDITVIVLYFVIALIVGLKASYGINSWRSYAVGDYDFRTTILVATIFVTWIDGFSTIGVASLLYESGVIWIIILTIGNFFNAFLTSEIIAPKIHPFHGAVTAGDIMEKFYGKNAKIFTGIIGVIYSTGTVGAQVYAMGYIFNLLTGLDTTLGIVLGASVVILYSSVGGIKAVTLTDFVQFAFIVVMVPSICNISLMHIVEPGSSLFGYKELFAKLPASHLKLIPEGWNQWRFWTMLIWFSIPFLDPGMLQRLLMARDIKQMRVSMRSAAFCYILFFLVASLNGLSALILFPDIKADMALPSLIINLLPVGIKGFAIAGLLAVVMSTADSYLNCSSIMMVNDVIESITSKKLNDQQKLSLAKLITFFIGIGSVLVAITTKSLVDVIIKFNGIWAVTVVVPLYAALFNIKVSQKAFATIATLGSVVFIAWEIFDLATLTYVEAIMPAVAVNVVVLSVIKLIEKYQLKLSMT